MKTMMQRLGAGVLLAGACASGAFAASSLGSGQTLAPGQSLDVGGSRLVMQGDCNLVLYRGAVATWHSETDGKGQGCRASMQADGNLVVYDNLNRPLWSSGTNGNPGAGLTLQTDGSLVIARGRQTIWSPNGNQYGQGGYGGQGGQGGYQGGYNRPGGGFGGYGNQTGRRGQDNLLPGQWLDGRRNDALTSRNRVYELRMQADCNLVLYARNQPIWESRTRGAGRDCRAIFTNGGELVVEADGRRVWSNRARARSGRPDLRMQDDGNLVAYDDQRAFWATNTENNRFGQGGFGGGYRYDPRYYDDNRGQYGAPYGNGQGGYYGNQR